MVNVRSASFTVRGTIQQLRNIVLGNPLPSSVSLEHRLPIILALPVFASDALSSVAYATQEILLQFKETPTSPINPIALSYLIGISLAIAILIVIVATSYRQAIHLYPSGGGSYSVSRDNLGVLPGLVAAASLFVDYVLTVAVSVSSGVENLVAFFKSLQGTVHVSSMTISIPVLLSVALILVIMLINLRGTKESGWLFALPAYTFVLMLTLALGMAFYRMLTHSWVPIDAGQVAETTTHTLKAISLIVILRAFSSGCSALTGVEAVSNGISAFEPPEAKNASKTLLVLMILLLVMFLGLAFATTLFHILPTEGETVISMVARESFGSSQIGTFLSLLMTFATLAILMIAANTSFAGFPRLLAIVAKDGYSAKSFANLGERLVHNQGIFVLTGLSMMLIIMFHAKTNALIPLYAVGVFICFTLSQFGMAKKASKSKGKGWQRTFALNLFGAVITGIVAVVQAYSKFHEGAWMVVVLLPLLVLFCYTIHRHYTWFDKTMTILPSDYNPLSIPPDPILVLVLVSSDIHRGTLEGLDCARNLVSGRKDSELRAVHIEVDPEKTVRLRTKWSQLVEPYLGYHIKLDVVSSPYRLITEPILEFLDQSDLTHPNTRIIIILPEFETGSFVTQFLHNFTAHRLRKMLMDRPNITIVSSRYFMRPKAWREGRGGLTY
ncbi:MAG TPA: APC family permease [Armatimonadota bacterium]|jgi:amino acid transporter